jgi:hypothetical protein
MDETIIADEQNEIDESNEESETEDFDANIGAEPEVDEEKEALRAKLEKAEADKEKWEARYKSTKKQESQTQVKKEVKDVPTSEDLDSVVERKLMAIQEQQEFIKTYGEDTYEAIKAIREKHPTLSLNDAYKISSVASDQPSKEHAESLSM